MALEMLFCWPSIYFVDILLQPFLDTELACGTWSFSGLHTFNSHSRTVSKTLRIACYHLVFVKNTISWASTSEPQICKTPGSTIYMQYNVNGAPWCCSMWQQSLPQIDWMEIFTFLTNTSRTLALRTMVNIPKRLSVISFIGLRGWEVAGGEGNRAEW